MTQSRALRTVAAGSIVVAVAVLGLKLLAWRVTGSVALYSDAVESVVNVVTAVVAMFTIALSALPADANHPYGHSKAEYFSAVLEGVLIIVAALIILRTATLGIMHPGERLHAPVLGLLINAGASIVNAAWCYVLISRGRRWRSPALVADGTHLLTDVYTSVGVIGGVLLVALTRWQPLDSIVAALVAVNIVWSGWRLLKEGFGGLMDEVLPPEELDRVQAIIDGSMQGALEAHDLRSRRAGRTTFIDFHLVMDGGLTVDASHRICDRIESALEAEFPGSVISIHVEPHWKREHGPMALGA